jgi:putative membrane protein
MVPGTLLAARCEVVVLSERVPRGALMNQTLLLFCVGALALGSACSRENAPAPATTQSGAGASSATDQSAAEGLDDAADTGRDMASAGTDTMVGEAEDRGTNDNTSGANPDAGADDAFFRRAAEGGMAEVEAGKLAQSKGSLAEVKSFGEMMVKDHSAANEELAKLATSAGAMLPTKLSAEHQAMKKKLQSLSGEAFDKEYIQGQIKDHEATVALLKEEIGSGQIAEVKAFAQKMLPTVEEHLKRIREIGEKAGIAGASTEG